VPLYPRLAASTVRLSLTSQGNIRYALKIAYRDSTTHVLFEPLDLIARQARCRCGQDSIGAACGHEPAAHALRDGKDGGATGHPGHAPDP